MSAEFPHLHARTQRLAQQSDEFRIRRIRTDRWIAYARAETALKSMEDLLTFPKRTRMPNLLIVGATNSGKTKIIEKFRRDHPSIAASATPEGVAHVPVLKVQMPSGPDEARFFGAILAAFNFPFMRSDRVAVRQDHAVRLMRETGVSLFAIDELNNLLSGTRLQQRRLLNLLRWIGNELQIPLVALGTAEALHAVQSDDQLANRFEPLGLPPWRNNDEYRQLLSTLEAILPLRHPSDLARSALASRILSDSEGILGEIVAIVTRAAVLAVESGEEAITAKTLEKTGYISPSDRRRVAI